VKAATPTQTLSRRELSLLNVLQLSDAVKHFAGVVVKDYGGIGGLKTVSVRSLGAEHTGVSYDGVAITDCQTGQIDLGRFSLENVDHLSLAVGQSGNIFQPARSLASAGMLNIVTLTPVFERGVSTHTNIAFKTGSWGFVNPSLRLEHRFSSRWMATGSGEWLSADGRYPFVLHYADTSDDLSTKEKRHNTEVRNLRLEGEVFGNFGDKEQLRVKVYYYRSSRGLPGATTYYYNHSSQHCGIRMCLFRRTTRKSSFHWALQAAAKWNWNYEHYLDPDYANSEGRRRTAIISRSTISPRRCSTERATIVVRSVDRASCSKLHANLYDFVYPTRILGSRVCRESMCPHYFSLTSSLLSTVTDEHVRQGSAGKNYHRLSPFVSLSVMPLSDVGLTLRAFYKDIFRLPTFNDLYYTSIGTRSLVPEKTKQFNVGATYGKQTSGLLSNISVSIDLYHNKVTDKIIAVPTKNLFVWSMTNLGKVDIKGLDVNGATTIAIDKQWQVDISGNYSYVKALDKTDAEGKTYDQQIPYTPRISASGRLALTSPWCTVAYSLLYSGKRYILGQNIAANKLGSYSDSSCSVSRSFAIHGVALSLSAELLNIMNKNYEIVKNFPMPGRSFRLLFNVRL
jgi:outer membrane cobalamin receptor